MPMGGCSMTGSVNFRAGDRVTPYGEQLDNVDGYRSSVVNDKLSTGIMIKGTCIIDYRLRLIDNKF